MRKLLVVAHPFPPTGGVSVQRTTKFCKYLPAFDWQPVVLTVREGMYPLRDEGLLSEIPPEVKVYRTCTWELSRQYRRFSGAGASGIPGMLKPAYIPAWKRVLRYLGKLVSTPWRVPDPHSGWVPPAVWEGWCICRRERPSAIYVTGDPFSSFLIAWGIHWLTGLPWIVDFRDGWTMRPFDYGVGYSKARLILEQCWEHAILKSVHHAVFTTDALRQSYANCYPDLETKFVTIMNGFDPEDFASPPEVVPDDSALRIVHAGRFTTYRRPAIILRALRLALDRRPDACLCLILVGPLEQPDERLIRDHGLDDVVISTGFLSHRQAIAYMCSAQVLLLIVGDSPGIRDVIPGKLFEYLAAGRFVMMLGAAKGEAVRVIRETGAGVVVPHDDAEAVCVEILRLYDAYRAGVLPVGATNVECFDRRYQARQLSTLLNGIVEG